jgi:ABC-2 type transport system ATP-binding protein
MAAAIEVAGLRKAFGDHTVLDGLAFEVDAGEVFALLGPNGAGKTTTIDILTTLTSADAGVATIAGCDLVDDPLGVRERIAVTGQSAAVDDVLTGRENLVMLARLSGLSTAAARRRAGELLERLELADAADRRVATYSGGMRRRLDLALSFVVPPEVLFLDEPTTGLDTRSRRELWDVIRSLTATGTTVFLTTQYLEEADQLADRIGLLDRGALVAQGTPGELKALVGTETLQVRNSHGDLVLHVPTDGTVPGLRRALAELDDAADGLVDLRRPTLDDVFLTLTGEDRRAAGLALEERS